MTNPSCPNCHRIMISDWRNTIVGTEMKGRAKFWICKKCKIQFKIGAETILRKTEQISEKELNKRLKQLQPKDIVGWEE